jgi:hypothetical protein
MRAVHAREGVEAVRQLLAVGLGQRPFGEPEHLGCHSTASLVLQPERRHQFGELARLLEAREDEVLFEMLVIVLDDVAKMSAPAARASSGTDPRAAFRRDIASDHSYTVSESERHHGIGRQGSVSSGPSDRGPMASMRGGHVPDVRVYA